MATRLLQTVNALLLSIAFATSISAVAQPQFQWAKGIQTTYNVNGSGTYSSRVFRSANGSLYQLGTAFYCNDFNPEAGLDTACVTVYANNNFIPGSPTSNFISRYNATTGAYGKTRFHPFEFSTPVFTDSGFIYFTGFFQGTQDFDPGPGTFNLTAQATVTNGRGCDYFLVKCDTAYNLVWAKRIAKSDNASYQQIRQTLCDAQGNVYILAEFSPHMEFVGQSSWGYQNGTAAGFLAKFNPAGNLLWANRIYTGSYAQVYGLAQDRTGNIIVSGYAGNAGSQPLMLTFTGTNGNVTAGPMTSQYSDAFVAKYSPAGAVLWAKNLVTGPDYQESSAVAVDSIGNIFITGFTYGATTFDSSNIQSSTFTASASNVSNTRRESYLAKYSPQGVFQWFKQLAPTTSTGFVWTNGIAIDANGHVYVGGWFDKSINLTAGAVQPVQYTTLSTNGDAFLVSYAGWSGQYVWNTRFTPAHSATIQGLHTDKFRNLYVTGTTSHTTNFNPGGSGGTVTYVDFFPQAARPRGFLLKYSIPQAAIVDEQVGLTHLLLHPNPTTGTITLEGATPGTSFAVVSVLGQRVGTGTVTASTQTVSLKSLPSATYMLVFTAPDGTRTAVRVIKQ